jgi:hypothetical protein
MCDSILQQCEIPEIDKAVAINRVFNENLQGFSRYYDGAYGACIGFALLSMYDDSEEAKDSYFAKRASEVSPELDSHGVSKLIDYVFRKYGDES